MLSNIEIMHMNITGITNRWDKYFFTNAVVAAEMSTCLRRSVGAVLVKDKRIIATGFNGQVKNTEHCKTCYRLENEIPSGQMSEKCLHGETVVKLLNGEYKTIKKLSEEGDDFWVYAIDQKTGGVVPAKATLARKTGVRSDLVEVFFDNGKTLKCTKDHKILKRDGTFVEAGKLKKGDSLMPLYYRISANGSTLYEIIRGKLLSGVCLLKNLASTEVTSDNYAKIRENHKARKNRIGGQIPKAETLISFFGSIKTALKLSKNHNHTVMSVEEYEGSFPVYDLTVPGYENFAVDLGDSSCVFVHNCYAVHAEQNAIAQCASQGISSQNSTLYCTHKPCFTCAKILFNSGIIEINYLEDYPDELTEHLFNETGTLYVTSDNFCKFLKNKKR